MISNEELSDKQLDEDIEFATKVYRDAASILHDLKDEKARRLKALKQRNKLKLAVERELGGKSYIERMSECRLLLNKQYDSGSVVQNYGFNIDIKTAEMDEVLLNTMFKYVTYAVLDSMLEVLKTGATVKRRKLVNVMATIHRRMEHPKIKEAMAVHKLDG